ncbi:MAG: LysR family transcriptional regulator [bacterium]|nr:MAG: LysR family transcriptional regulator [bacterium]
MSVDFRQLRAFDAVARCGGFSKASREVGLTQPTLSTHISNLEQQLGVRLFDRSGRSVILTPAGKVLAGYAKRILNLCEESVQAVEVFTGSIKGTVHVDASTVPGEYILPRWLIGFRDRYPQVQVILNVSDSSVVLERVESGETSIGVTGSPGTKATLDSRLLTDDKILLVSAPQVAGPDRAEGPPGEILATLPLIRREPGSGTQIAVEEALREMGMEPDSLRWSVTLGSTRAVIEGALAGLGAAFLSASTVSRELAEGTLVPIGTAGLRIRRGFYVVTNSRRTLSPVAARFLEELMATGRGLTSGGRTG